jgi:hypothetical protein
VVREVAWAVAWDASKSFGNGPTSPLPITSAAAQPSAAGTPSVGLRTPDRLPASLPARPPPTTHLARRNPAHHMRLEELERVEHTAHV